MTIFYNTVSLNYVINIILYIYILGESPHPGVYPHWTSLQDSIAQPYKLLYTLFLSVLLNHATECFQHNPILFDITKKCVWQNIMWEEKHIMWVNSEERTVCCWCHMLLNWLPRVESNSEVALMEDTVLQNKGATLETDLSPADENTSHIMTRSKQHSSSKSWNKFQLQIRVARSMSDILKSKPENKVHDDADFSVQLSFRQEEM
jgi:hypothetical protein